MGKIEAAQLRDEISLDMDKVFLDAYTDTPPRGKAFEDMVVAAMEEIMACGIQAAEAVCEVINRFPGQECAVQDLIADEFKYIPTTDVYQYV